jgi:hypothetical protein
MTKADVVGIMAILETAYPQYYAKRDNQQRTEAVNLWAELFAADPAPVVAAAIKAIIVSSTNPFPPSIGEIKNKMHDLTTPTGLSETEAWSMVSKALHNGIYGYAEEFANLPPTVQTAVGRAEQLREWALMPEDEVQSVVASNFMRGYKTIQKRERESALIPPDVRDLLSGVSAAMLPEVTP